MFKSFPSTNFPSRELVLFSHTQGHVITFAIMNAFYCKKIRYYILQLCRYKDKYSLDWIDYYMFTYLFSSEENILWAFGVACTVFNGEVSPSYAPDEGPGRR